MTRASRGLAVAVLLAASAVAAAEEAADVVILSPYRSRVGANTRPRLRPHAGVDFAAPVGTPVLAATDGVVSMLIDYEPGCGVGVVLSHPRFKRWTVYCHLTHPVVTTGQAVARGERIGISGASGNSAGVPHVHLELCTTDRKSTRLNSSHLVISYAVFCLKKKKNNNRIILSKHINTNKQINRQ